VPFTIAHPAAVLALRRTPLPWVGLVAGSVVPDVPLILQVPGYQITHAPWAALTVDVALGMVLVVAWFAGVGPAVVEAVPPARRPRLPSWPSRREWLLAPVAVALGALTHVVWDAFTHPGAWGTRLVPWLETQHAGLLGSRWLQYASGVIGCLVVGAALARHLAVRRGGDSLPARLGPRWYVGALAALTLVPLAAAALEVPDGVHAVAFEGARVGVLMLALVCAVLGVAWRRAGRRAMSSVGHPR
jgi:hypothetical protein